jgi:probable phosphoglycerate mutase
LYSDPEAPLTEKGTGQAQSVAQWLEREKPDVLLCGPSKRVVTTAQTIGSARGLTAKTIAELHEWNVGEWDGKTYLEIKKSEPELYGAWSKDPVRNAPPGGESIIQLCERAAALLQALHKEHEGKRVAIVTHSEIIRAFLAHALGFPVDNFWRVNVPTGSVSKVDLSANFATVQYLALVP